MIEVDYSWVDVAVDRFYKYIYIFISIYIYIKHIIERERERQTQRHYDYHIIARKNSTALFAARAFSAL